MDGRETRPGEGPAAYKLGDLLAHATGLPLDALQVAHKGCLVDKVQWGCSFAELAWGSRVELSVQAELAANPVQPDCPPPVGPNPTANPPTTLISPPPVVAPAVATLPTANVPHQGRHSVALHVTCSGRATCRFCSAWVSQNSAWVSLLSPCTVRLFSVLHSTAWHVVL